MQALSCFITLQTYPSDSSHSFRTHQPLNPAKLHKILPDLAKILNFVSKDVTTHKEFMGATGMTQAVPFVSNFLSDNEKTIVDVQVLVGKVGEMLFPSVKIFSHLVDT